MLLTIYVPTNTIDYVDSLVDKFISWKSTQTELLIAINGDKKKEVYDNLFKSIINQDSNVRFILLESENLIDSINESIPYIQGEYVTFIGNDDSFFYHIEKAVIDAKRMNYDAIKYPLNMVYFWPGVKKTESELIVLKTQPYRNLVEFNPKHAFKKLFRNVGQNYRSLNLVNFYHGVVRKDLLYKNLNSVGRFVGGYSPDIYFAYTLSHHTDRVKAINYPLTIPGIGNKSASQKSLIKTHQSNLISSPVRNYPDIHRWNQYLSDFYSVETVWASSLLVAHEDLLKRPYLDFNFNLLNLLVFLNNSEYRNLKEFAKLMKNVKLKEIMMLIGFIFAKILNRIKNGFSNRRKIHGVSITDLEELFNLYLTTK